MKKMAKACSEEECSYIALHDSLCYFCKRKQVREHGCMWVEDVMKVPEYGFVTFVDYLPEGMEDGDTLWQNGAPFDLIASVIMQSKQALILVPSVKFHGRKEHPEKGRTLSP